MKAISSVEVHKKPFWLFLSFEMRSIICLKKIFISLILLLLICSSKFQSLSQKIQQIKLKNISNFKEYIDPEIPSLVTYADQSAEDESIRKMTIENKQIILLNSIKKQTYKKAFVALEKFLNKKTITDVNINILFELGNAFRFTGDVIEYEPHYAGEIIHISYPKVDRFKAIYTISDSPVPLEIRIYAKKGNSFMLICEIPRSINESIIQKYYKLCSNNANCLIKAVQKDKTMQKAIQKEAQQLAQTFELK